MAITSNHIHDCSIFTHNSIVSSNLHTYSIHSNFYRVMPVWIGVGCGLSRQWSAKLMVWWHGRCVLTSGGGRRITVHAVSWAEGADVLWGLRLCSDGPGAAWPPHTRQHTTTSTPTENDKSNNNDEEVRVWACFAGCHRHAGAGGGEVIEANRDIQVPSTRPTWADSVLSRLTHKNS